MMPTLLLHILYLILGLFILFLFFENLRNHKKNQSLPPGPRGLPIIGKLHQLDITILHQQLLQLSKKYGPIFSLKLGLRNAIVISSTKLAKEALKDHDLVFSGRPKFHAQQKLSYNGQELAFSQYNAHYKDLRKIYVIHVLSVRRVSCFSSIRQFEVKHMIEKISKHASSSKVTNLSEIVMALTSTIICRTAFGRRYEEKGVEKSKFHDLLNEFQSMVGSFFVSDYIPFLGWIDRVSGVEARLERIFKEMDKFYQEIIDEHMNSNRMMLERDQDIVDILLRLKNEHSISIDITFDHIKAVLTDMLVAATDTLASTIVWAMTALMRNPRVMKKVQEEIRSLGFEKDFLEEDDIKQFTYIKAVIKETLRFHPPVPLLQRKTTENCTIDGYHIPAESLVFVNTWAIHKDPEIWKDPEEFYPERFLSDDGAIDFRGRDFEFIPFGAGHRICPGLNMADVSLDLIIGNLIYLFDWELPEGMKKEDIDIEISPGIVRHKKNPLCLVAKRRI